MGFVRDAEQACKTPGSLCTVAHTVEMWAPTGLHLQSDAYAFYPLAPAPAFEYKSF